MMSKYIGNKQFYKKMLLVMVPIALQNGITNFVSLLDNIMVGRVENVGTLQMSGVSISNQLIFVYSLCIFGALSGAGIFTTQYYGKKDKEGLQHTIRYKVLIALVLTTIAIILLLLFGKTLISFYLNGKGNKEDILMYGHTYLLIMLVGLPAFMVMQIYSTTLRECSKPILPMISGLIAVAINLAGNYILIYGMFGLPALGSTGAAIATVFARYIEAIINIIGAHTNKDMQYYLDKIYHTLMLPFPLFKRIFITGLPLLLNETLWAAGIAMLSQCYSLRGMDVVASLNISNTISNVVNTIFIALGIACGIIVGQYLGANQIEEAKSAVPKMIVFGVFSSLLLTIFMCKYANVFPAVYKSEMYIQDLAAKFIFIQALFMPLQSYINCIYFTLRAGGKTFITFLFDSAFVWCVGVSIAFSLSHFTSLNVLAIFLCVQLADIIKACIGTVMLKKGIWIQNLVC